MDIQQSLVWDLNFVVVRNEVPIPSCRGLQENNRGSLRKSAISFLLKSARSITVTKSHVISINSEYGATPDAWVIFMGVSVESRREGVG